MDLGEKGGCKNIMEFHQSKRLKMFDCLFGLFYVCVRMLTDVKTIGHRIKSTPTNGPRFTVPSLPWWSPMQVLTEVDVY